MMMGEASKGGKIALLSAFLQAHWVWIKNHQKMSSISTSLTPTLMILHVKKILLMAGIRSVHHKTGIRAKAAHRVVVEKLRIRAHLSSWLGCIVTKYTSV